MQPGRHRFSSARITSAAFAALAIALLQPAAALAQLPAPGMFLVATEEVRGPFFMETVVLLLHYDDGGALGLVVNRPMGAKPGDVLPDLDGIDRYEGALYWGGPVQLTSLRALLRSETPPPDAVHVVDEVYLVAPEAKLPAGAIDATRLRFFLGYAGWAAGQLDGELLDDSWHIVPATGDLVFDADTAGIWRRITPPRSIRAALPQAAEALASLAPPLASGAGGGERQAR